MLVGVSGDVGLLVEYARVLYIKGNGFDWRCAGAYAASRAEGGDLLHNFGMACAVVLPGK